MNPNVFAWRISRHLQAIRRSEAFQRDHRIVVAGLFGAILEVIVNPKGPDWALAAERTCITNEYLRDIMGYKDFEAFVADINQARLEALPA